MADVYAVFWAKRTIAGAPVQSGILEMVEVIVEAAAVIVVIVDDELVVGAAVEHQDQMEAVSLIPGQQLHKKTRIGPSNKFDQPSLTDIFFVRSV